MVFGEGEGLSLTIHVAWELYKDSGLEIVLWFPACPASEGMASFLVRIPGCGLIQGGTKKVSSNVYPAFLKIPESTDTLVWV